MSVKNPIQTLAFPDESVDLFSSNDLATIDRVLNVDTPSLRQLAIAAGQDPQAFYVKRDFRGLDLSGVDVRQVNLSYADLTGTNLRLAITDASTRLESARIDDQDKPALFKSGALRAPTPPPGCSNEAALAMILEGRAPPLDWRPWITELGFPGRSSPDLALLDGLTALQTLILWKTKVSDVSVLSGLTALQQLDLSHTQVSDVSALSGLTALQQVVATNARLAKIYAAQLGEDFVAAKDQSGFPLARRRKRRKARGREG